jgi:hypothetical protein
MPQPHGQRRIARNLRPRPDDDYCNTRECIPAGAPPQGRYPAIHPADLPADIVLPRLIGVQRSTNGWTALCPAHPDENPSLSVAETAEGNLLVKCFRDCTAEEIMEAIGLQLQYLFASGYAKAMAQRHERHAGGGSRGLLARSRYAPGRPSPARLAALQDRYTEATAGATHLDCLGGEVGRPSGPWASASRPPSGPGSSPNATPAGASSAWSAVTRTAASGVWPAATAA